MAYILVMAEFPGVNEWQKLEIEKCLQYEHWHKVSEKGKNMDTAWYAPFPGVSEQVAVKVSIDNFVSCSKRYCKCKLLVHWGPDKPTTYGLV